MTKSEYDEWKEYLNKSVAKHRVEIKKYSNEEYIYSVKIGGRYFVPKSRLFELNDTEKTIL